MTVFDLGPPTSKLLPTSLFIVVEPTQVSELVQKIFSSSCFVNFIFVIQSVQYDVALVQNKRAMFKIKVCCEPLNALLCLGICIAITSVISIQFLKIIAIQNQLYCDIPISSDVQIQNAKELCCILLCQVVLNSQKHSNSR